MKLTLEEAMKELASNHMSLEYYPWDMGDPDGYWIVRGQAPKQGEDGFDPDVQRVIVAKGREWPEAVTRALGWVVVEYTELKEYKEAHKSALWVMGYDDTDLQDQPVDAIAYIIKQARLHGKDEAEEELAKLRKRNADLDAILDIVRRWFLQEFAEPNPAKGEAVEEFAREMFNAINAVLAWGDEDE